MHSKTMKNKITVLMKKIKKTAGIIWAFAGMLIILMLFPGLNSLSGALARAPFMKIHPRYSGGERMYESVNDCCTLEVRRPVFKGLINDRKDGFIQLEWKGTIPVVIKDSIDYNCDGKADFLITVDTKLNRSSLKSFSDRVTGIGISTSTSYGWAVRVNLKKELN